MAKRRVEHRGVYFVTFRNPKGYEWRRQVVLSDSFELVVAAEEVLVPVGATRKVGLGGVGPDGGAQETVEMSGFAMARSAFNRFKKLADAITRRVDSAPVGLDIYGMYVPHHLDDGEAKALIVAYADEFGALWGDADWRTVHDWRAEAEDFLALYEVARFLRPGSSTAAFERRLDIDGNDGPAMVYRPHPWTMRMVVAAEGERAGGSDVFALATAGSSRFRARMLFNRTINAKLVGGLSWNASVINDSEATIKPHQLVNLLYLRLWLDTVEDDERGEDGKWTTTCLNCGREITGTKRKKYCGDRCRTAYNNRRRAQS